MYNFKSSERAKGLLLKCKVTNSELFKKTETAIRQLVKDPWHPGLRTHKTCVRIQRGKAFSSWASGEYRLIWDWSKAQPNTILLIDFGTHKEVYL